MAKFVIAGCANCPRFAKMELLADKLCVSLPDFDLFKIVKSAEDWKDWIQDKSRKNGWTHDQGKPIAWRELLDRGGKGSYIGGFNEFLEYAQGYYGLTLPLNSIDSCQIAKENDKTNNEVMEEEEDALAQIQPLVVCITSATCPIAYHFIPRLVKGDIFGQETEIRLKLLDTEENLEMLQGLAMETADGCWPLFRGVAVFTDPRDAFQDAKVIIMLDDWDINDFNRRSAYIESHAKVFKNYAHILEDVLGLGETGSESEMVSRDSKAKAIHIREEAEETGDERSSVPKKNSDESGRKKQSSTDSREQQKGSRESSGQKRSSNESKANRSSSDKSRSSSQKQSSGGNGEETGKGSEEEKEEEKEELGKGDDAKETTPREGGGGEGSGDGVGEEGEEKGGEEGEEEEKEEPEPEVTVLLAGPGPVTIQAQVLLNTAPRLSPSCRVVAVSGLEEILVKSFLAKKLDVRTEDVADVIIWGLNNVNVHPDISYARAHNHASSLYGPEWYSDHVLEKIYDRTWLEEYTQFMKEFMEGHCCKTNLAVQSANMVQRQKASAKLKKLQERDLQGIGTSRDNALPHLPHITHVDAICIFFNNYLRGSDPNRFYSCAIPSDGSYGVPEGLVFSFPCSFVAPRKIEIIGNLELSDDTKEAIERMGFQMIQACQKVGVIPIIQSEESKERMRLHQLELLNSDRLRGWRRMDDTWSLMSLTEAGDAVVTSSEVPKMQQRQLNFRSELEAEQQTRSNSSHLATAVGLRVNTQTRFWGSEAELKVTEAEGAGGDFEPTEQTEEQRKRPSLIE